MRKTSLQNIEKTRDRFFRLLMISSAGVIASHATKAFDQIFIGALVVVCLLFEIWSIVKGWNK